MRAAIYVALALLLPSAAVAQKVIRDYPAPTVVGPGDQVLTQPAGPRTTPYKSPTWGQVFSAFGGTGGGGGSNLALLVDTGGRVLLDSLGREMFISGSGAITIRTTDLPTSCAGPLPRGTFWNNSNNVSLCP